MSIDKRPNGAYRARWRETPGGPQKAATFDRKIDAQRHLTKIQHELLSGTYIDPRQAQTPLAVYAACWLERMRRTWRPGTTASVDVNVRLHIVPTLGKMPLAAIKRADVEAWAAALDLSPATVATVRQHLGQILSAAVEDGLLARNPAAGARIDGTT